MLCSLMDRAMLEQHLAEARQHPKEGMHHIVRQREIIAELEARGSDTTEAKWLLSNFEESQALHLQISGAYLSNWKSVGRRTDGLAFSKQQRIVFFAPANSRATGL